MNRIYLELMIDDNGNITRTTVVSSEKIRERKKGTKAYKRGEVNESPDIATLKRAILVVGGIPALAAMLGMTRANIYNFIYRNKVHPMHMERIAKIILEKEMAA